MPARQVIPGGAEELVRAVCEGFPASSSPLHGERHWLCVAEAGSRILQLGSSADRVIVFLFALLHDSQRQSEGRDPGHGRRAADFARYLVDEGYLRLSTRRLELLQAALIDHDAGKVSEDATVGACWDADRLNLVRLGFTLKTELLSTEAGQELAPAAGEIVAAERSWRQVIDDFELGDS